MLSRVAIRFTGWAKVTLEKGRNYARFIGCQFQPECWTLPGDLKRTVGTIGHGLTAGDKATLPGPQTNSYEHSVGHLFFLGLQ